MRKMDGREIRGVLLMISVTISKALDVMDIRRMRLTTDGFMHVAIKQISTKGRQDFGFEMVHKDTVSHLKPFQNADK